MRYTITIDTDASAFEDNGEAREVARILHGLADRIEREDGFEAGTVIPTRDANGNRAGWLTVASDDEDTVTKAGETE